MDNILEYQQSLRFGSFLLALAGLAAWEYAAPRRRLHLARSRRWQHNLALLAIDAAVLRILAPGAAIAIALAGETHGWGFLNSFSVPGWAAVLAGVLLLDLVIYFQHVMFHAVPLLWRLHRVHHTDTEIDVTTGTRFHPIEILVSTVVKCAAVAAIGVPAVGVLLFELLLNVLAMFNHSNIRVPAMADRVLRTFVVTPDMHRVHHSILHDESSSNFGFNAPWWDHLFGTYRAQPIRGHEGMTIGVDAFRAPEDQRIDRLLLQPLRDTPGGHPIDRRPEVADS